jgi:hypothetical protein
VRFVSGRERRMTSQDNTGNHCVPQFTRAPSLIPQRHQITSLLRCDRIKDASPNRPKPSALPLCVECLRFRSEETDQ